ncbi:hypothetical protein OCGS_0408 [Oceaniovalibus guishaninsula JLT2003]|uniref:Cellulose biosynthesis protein BcsS n=1 Tax=Oceaniovalibus guishaninsula JLT2003 TaxID=1231392 RepID=K2HD05_9RHOB|nr:hypothetical protein [Oceaniovalibus guishaninsula]EKE45318.1 hypothetical protein OCGS_0408 [Oceaniovalibus guishaninsula JLT2003]
MRFLVPFLLLILPAMAQAGAWPRDHRGVFVSASRTYALSSYGILGDLTSAYAEYGLTPRLTIGAKLDRSDQVASETVAFARIPLGRTDRRDVFAAQVGFGNVRQPGEASVAIIQPALLYGRGFDGWLGSGWIGAEVRASIAAEGRIWGNLDLTVGFNPTENSHLIFQVQTWMDEYNHTVTLAPSYVRRLWGPVKTEIGLLYDPARPDYYGVKGGVWIEF